MCTVYLCNLSCHTGHVAYWTCINNKHTHYETLILHTFTLSRVVQTYNNVLLIIRCHLKVVYRVSITYLYIVPISSFFKYIKYINIFPVT